MQECYLDKKTEIVVNRLLKLFHRKATNEILGEARQSLVQQFNFRFFFFCSHFQMFPQGACALKILLWQDKFKHNLKGNVFYVILIG